MTEQELTIQFKKSSEDAARLLKKRGLFKQNYVEYIEKSFDNASKNHGRATSKILNKAAKQPLTSEEIGTLIDSFVFTLGALQARVSDPIRTILYNESAAEFMKEQFAGLGISEKNLKSKSKIGVK